MPAAVSRLILSCFVYYCTAPLCPAGVKNVGCDPPPLSGGLGCAGKNAAVIAIGPEEQDVILTILNTGRNNLASGIFLSFGFGSAVRMLKLKWDAELASQAGHKARTCEYTKDACRNTAKYSNVGQLITKFIPTYDVTVVEKKKLLADAIGGSYFAGFIQSSSPYDWGNAFHDKADAIGCALQQYDENGSSIFYLVCNMSAANTVGQGLYVTGPTASGCTSGRDQTYSSLCSSAEVI